MTSHAIHVLTGPEPAGRRRPLRLGVEEEFLLLDPDRRTTVPRAEQVLAEASGKLGDRVQREFYRTQIEGCTPPVRTAAELRAELTRMRGAVSAAAARSGCLLVASGTAVLPSRHPLPVSDTERYRLMAAQAGPVADQTGGELCGCHIHLGDLDRGEALTLSRRLRPWLPVFQTMSANSAFCEGHDLGVASWRTLRHRNWPTVGPTPPLDAHSYEYVADQLVRSATVLDRRAIYWYARPSEHLPTLEVRIADVNADLDVTVLLALLLRGLAEVLLRRDGSNSVKGPPIGGETLREAHRQAAICGLRGTGLDPLSGAWRPMPVLVAELLEHAAPGLAAAGDAAEAARLTRRLLERGTGADRQRAVFARRWSLLDVVDDLASLTAAGTRPSDRKNGRYSGCPVMSE